MSEALFPCQSREGMCVDAGGWVDDGCGCVSVSVCVSVCVGGLRRQALGGGASSGKKNAI